MLRHPPLSSLFPYTTLFRSEPAPVRARRTRDHRFKFALSQEKRAAGEVAQPRHGLARHGNADQFARSQQLHRHDRTSTGTQDRKSTRLNSSHTVISYAVFCLNATSSTALFPLSLHDALPI